MEQSRKGRSAEQLMFMSGAKLPMMREASSCVAWLNRFGIEVIEYLAEKFKDYFKFFPRSDILMFSGRLLAFVGVYTVGRPVIRKVSKIIIWVVPVCLWSR